MCRRGVHYREGRVACDGCGLPTDCCLCEPVAGARPAAAVADPGQAALSRPALPPPKRPVAATPLPGRQADEPPAQAMQDRGYRVVRRRRKRADEARARLVRRRRAPPTGSRTGLDLSPEGELEERPGTVQEPPAGQPSAEPERPPAQAGRRQVKRVRRRRLG